MDQKELLQTSGHAAYSLQVHVIFVTKYRHACLSASMLASMREHVARICEGWRCELLEFNGEADHVHLLLSLHPTVAIASLVSNLKTVTARRIRADYAGELKAYYWKPVFWAAAYAAFSVGSADLNTVRNYIRNQETPVQHTLAH